MLREIAGKALISWVYEAVRASTLLSDVIVATAPKRSWKPASTTVGMHG